METVLALCRFVHFVSAMSLFGIGLFAGAFLPLALRNAISPPLRGVAMALGIVAWLSALAWLAIEAAAMGGDISLALDPATLFDVLCLTAFGEVWEARLVIGLALVLSLFVTPPRRWTVIALLAGASVATLGLVGHAAIQNGALGLLHRGNDALHLLCAAAWLGGLPPFILCLRAYEDEALRIDAARAMRNFSMAGQSFVALLWLTGALNIALTTGDAPWPPATPYRLLLLTKIVLASGMVALALFNRLVLTPRIETGAAAARAMRRTSLAEIALALAVVGLVSGFGLLDPT